MAESGEELKEPLNEGERGECKNGLKLNIKKTKIIATVFEKSSRIVTFHSYYCPVTALLELLCLHHHEMYVDATVNS